MRRHLPWIGAAASKRPGLARERRDRKAPVRFKTALCASTLAVLLVSGCSAPPETAQEKTPAGEAPPSTETLAEAAGVIEGRVIFEGETVPEPTRVRNTTDPEHCGEIHSLENILVSPANRGLQNVAVTLTGIELPEGYRAPVSQLVVDNQDCRFEPHVAVLTAGSSIKAVNSDPIYHSVHLYGLKNINISLHISKSRVVELPNRPGKIIVKCDVHGWMQAYIQVDPHPFHAVTGEDGGFRIAGIPAGTHSLEAWHEHFGSRKIQVTVNPDQTSNLVIPYAADVKEKKP